MSSTERVERIVIPRRPAPVPVRDLIVADIVKWPSPQIDLNRDGAEAFERMRESGVRHLLVTDDGVAVGIACELEAVEMHRAPVGEIAHDPLVVSLWDSATAVAQILAENNACAVAVAIPNHTCAILTREDLTGAGICGPWPRCEACGSDHRVRAILSSGVHFCAECLEHVGSVEPDNLYVDLGVVD